jgi:hypothetical protein
MKPLLPVGMTFHSEKRTESKVRSNSKFGAWESKREKKPFVLNVSHVPLISIQERVLATTSQPFIQPSDKHLGRITVSLGR